MNIGIVTIWSEQGAAYVSRQYRDVLKTQHNVFIYARSGESQAKGNSVWDDKYVTWDNQTILRSKQVVNTKQFIRWIEDNKLELVFFNEQHHWEPVLICNKLGIKTGAYIDYYTKETVPLFACYDFLICNTKRHYSVFKWHPQAFYVPWGTDIDLYRPTSSSAVVPNYVTFFHSAGINPHRKGTDLLLQAFASVSGNARLIIHSQKKIEIFFPKLKKLIQTIESSGRLIYHMQTVPAPGLYHLGDIYVYPSRLDGIGLTVAEALACGLPVITSDNPPMNEFINSTSGYLVKISKMNVRNDGYFWPECCIDIEHLRNCMQKYVDMADCLSDSKVAARSYAEKYLCWEINAKNLPVLFENILKTKSWDKSPIELKARIFEKNKFSFYMRIIRIIKRALIFNKEKGKYKRSI